MTHHVSDEMICSGQNIRFPSEASVYDLSTRISRMNILANLEVKLNSILIKNVDYLIKIRTDNPING